MGDAETQGLVRARDESRRAQDGIDRAVTAARAAGMGWEEIALVLELDVADLATRASPTVRPRGRSNSRRELTNEEEMIVDLISKGVTNQSIADRLFLSKRSLEVRLTQLYRALGVAGKADLRRTHRASSLAADPTVAPRPSAELPVSVVAAQPPTSSGPGASGRKALGPEEQMILQLVLDGQTTADIAAQLFLSKRSVELRLTTIYRAFGVSRKAQLRGALEDAPARAWGSRR